MIARSYFVKWLPPLRVIGTVLYIAYQVLCLVHAMK